MLARLEALPARFRKIVGNQPAPLLADPCPWTRDQMCDEPPVDGLCALGTDVSDCSVDGEYVSVHYPDRDE